jgi:hypothetical protein
VCSQGNGYLVWEDTSISKIGSDGKWTIVWAVKGTMSPGTLKNFLPSTSNMMESTGPMTAEEAETIALKFWQMLLQGEL